MSVMIPAVGREVHLVARPTGEPTTADFALADAPVAPPAAGQVLVRNDWFSVDPYMRGRMNDVNSYLPPFALGAPMDGGAVGTVVESSAASIPLGTPVLHNLGWRENATVDAAAVRALDTAAAPTPAYLGVLGVTGLTAYVGLKLIAPVREGDVVFVSGAAGAVGIVAGRVARALGAAKVIGSAGGREKARRLVEDFGYDDAIDYQDGALPEQLRVAAPGGIDVYFDNVGGDHLRAALTTMRRYGFFSTVACLAGFNSV